MSTPYTSIPVNFAPVSQKLRKSSSEPQKRIRSETQSASSKRSFISPAPCLRLGDLGGLDCIKELTSLVLNPFNPQYLPLYTSLKVSPARGLLLTGPPGCGKSILASALAGEIHSFNPSFTFFKVRAVELISGISGESEGNIRALFEEAITNSPSLILLDEVDAIAPKRESAAREMEKRIVSQLMTAFDSLADATGALVMVIATTSRPESLDLALRRPGRFDREISLRVPSRDQRAHLISVLSNRRGISLTDHEIFELAQKTPGYVGADIELLMTEAGLAAVERYLHGITSSTIPMDSDTNNSLENFQATVDYTDLTVALTKVQPNAIREGFATVPDVTWDDVGALDEVHTQLRTSILEPILHPEKFEALGLPISTGVLLYGPPGCGKTLLAKAIANESGANFIYVKGPELLNKYVGESERAVRLVFERARFSAPCVVFFDELDALCPKRGGEGNQSSERVVNQLLTEMDGLDSNRQVFVIAATNRPDIIDPAMLRPGRLDLLIYVPLPNENGRKQILLRATRKLAKSHTCSDALFDHLAARTDGFSGADLSMLVRESALLALKDSLDNNTAPVVDKRHFLSIVNNNKILPSVNDQAKKRYESLTRRLRQSRVSGIDQDKVE
ncbi:hypothetical protein RCL1_007368 [Eukaryota sp. TZLM3-RCL]